jgi:hypothetical protein
MCSPCHADHLRLGYRSGGCSECYPPVDLAPDCRCSTDTAGRWCPIHGDPEDEPDPEPVDDADVPAGACWCHDAAPCPDVLSDMLAEREPLDIYRAREW